LGEYVRDTNNNGKWTIVRNGDTSFLSGGEERNWWFDGDIPGDDPEITRLIGSRDTTEEDKSKL
jgi:transcription factor C subunit 7